METPMKRNDANEDEDKTDTEYSPQKQQKEEFKKKTSEWRRNFPFLPEFHQLYHGYIVAEDVSVVAFQRFLEMNDLYRYGKRISLFNHEVYFDELFDAPESRVHVRGNSFFLELGVDWIRAMHAPPRKFLLSSNSAQSLTTTGSYIVPDFCIELKGRAIFVVEIVYSSGLRAGHRKLQEYFRGGHCRSGIIVYIRYPWSHDQLYFLDDGELFFIYYSAPTDPNDPAIPEKIVSFGGTTPTEQDLKQIAEITGFTGNYEGNIVTNGGILCDEANQEDAVFNHMIPQDVLLLDEPINEDDPHRTIFGNQIGDLQEQFEFVVKLYDLKEWLLAGIEEMNEAIVANQATVVAMEPRIF